MKLIGPKGPQGPTKNYEDHPDYQSLPESVKAVYTQKEYAWLDDESRNNLLRDMTLPEVAED